jgi:hypothetical protein
MVEDSLSLVLLIPVVNRFYVATAILISIAGKMPRREEAVRRQAGFDRCRRRSARNILCPILSQAIK